MVKVFYGNKGVGKTKMLVDTANNLAAESAGDIVFIDDSNQLICELKHKIRFVNVSDFPVEMNPSVFLGFVCGMISEDYDIRGILIDGLTYILKEEADALKEFFDNLNKISLKYDMDFYISMNGKSDNVPEYLKEYIAN